MDRHLIDEKLESLRRCLERVRSRCPATTEVLATDLDAQDIIALNLTRAVQLCVDLAAHLIADRSVPAPDSMGEAFLRLRSVGILDESTCSGIVHSYRAIDWAIVHRICIQNLADFEQFARQVILATTPGAPPSSRQ